MIHLRGLRYDPPEETIDEYPFAVPTVAALGTLEFTTPVTCFVGENGAGKSTLLEAIATGLGMTVAGGHDLATDPTLGSARRLSERLRFSWQKRTRRGFFLRAEDFFSYTRRTAGLVTELGAMAEDFGDRFTGYGRDLAQGAALGQQRALVERYGEDLDHRSHGEGFLQFFGARFVPDGLYLLDEPDTPLSPQRQLALVAMLKGMVAEGGQFIIATHSPILMAFPHARILTFDQAPVSEVAYDDVEQVVLMRQFLARPESYTRQL